MTFEIGFIWAGLIQVISFFIQGCAGFGSTVIAAPVVMAVLGTAEGIPYGTVISLPFLYYLGIKSIKNVSWKDLIKIILFCMPGVLFGNFIFAKISPSTAKISIGAMITLIALMNIYKFIISPLVLKKEVQKDQVDTTGKKIFRYSCLILGGVVHGAFNIGGPLITVYTIEAVDDKEKFRNTMTWVWIILNTVFNASSQFRNGAWTPRMWSALAVGTPMAAVGFYFGMKFMSKINKEQFLRIVYVVLLIVGGDMFIRNVLAVL